MTRHPWVAAADNGPRFGVALPGLQGRGADGEFHAYEQPAPVILEAARFADQRGIDGIFVGDDIVYGRLPHPFVMLGAIAGVTDHADLGTMVTSPIHQYPTQLARAVSDLDHLSNGRTVLGIGSGIIHGGSERVAQWLGIPRLTTHGFHQRLEESIEILKGLWSEDTFTYHGEQFQLTEVEGIPEPDQQPNPPIVVSGTSEHSLRTVVRYGDGCNFNFTPNIPDCIEQIHRYGDEDGRDPDEILITQADFLVLAPTESELAAKRDRMAPPRFFETRRERGLLGDATPEQAVEYFGERIEQGVQYFISMPIDTADHETIQLLAEDVMPHFK